MSTTANASVEPGTNADRADVDRVLAGDVNAFEGIVRRWQGPLVNMAWRYCRDRGRAEEMAQEALVRSWRGAVCLPVSRDRVAASRMERTARASDESVLGGAPVWIACRKCAHSSCSGSHCSRRTNSETSVGVNRNGRSHARVGR